MSSSKIFYGIEINPLDCKNIFPEKYQQIINEYEDPDDYDNEIEIEDYINFNNFQKISVERIDFGFYKPKETQNDYIFLIGIITNNLKTYNNTYYMVIPNIDPQIQEYFYNFLEQNPNLKCLKVQQYIYGEKI